jgi:hypothetical protein
VRPSVLSASPRRSEIPTMSIRVRDTQLRPAGEAA